MTKEKDILNPCGHRNSERVEALMKFPSVCPACLLERIKELEAEKENLRQYASGLENAQNLITVRYRKIEAALQGMVPFIEDDFPIGTGTNHGTCATDEYQQACDAVIKAINS